MEAADYKFSQGQQLLRSGDYQAAVQAFSVAIILDPNHRSAYFRRAEAYRHLGLVEQANADLERAEFLMPATRQEADVSGGAFVGGMVGGIIGGVGASFGSLFLLGGDCWTGWCLIIFSPVGGFVGGGIGGVIGRHLESV